MLTRNGQLAAADVFAKSQIAAQVPIYASPEGIAAQFDFYDNDLINTVNERFLKLDGNASVTGDKYNSTGGGDAASTESIFFEGEEDFTIQCKLRYSAHNSANLGIIGNWVAAADTKSRWYLLWEGSTGKYTFYYRTGATLKNIAFTCAKPTFNVDHHFAVTRKNGVCNLFLNGIKVVSGALAGGQTNDIGIATGMLDTSTGITGTRWDVQILKGICLWENDFTVPGSLLRVGRTEYIDDSVVCQVEWRRNNNINEANGKAIKKSTSDMVLQGKLTTTTAVGSQFSIPLDRKWGSGDFTIECKIRVNTALGAGNSAVLLGHWFNGTGGDNRWCISHSQSNPKFLFALARSTAASDYPVVSAPTNYVVGREHHVVVERKNGVITLYMDGVAGTPVSQSTALRGELPFVVNNFISGATQTTNATISDIRISDKAVYSGTIVKQLFFPKIKAVTDYTSAELADILVQCSGERGMVRNEKTGALVSIAGTARRIHNALTTTAAYSSNWSIPAPTLPQRSNMTFESKFNIVSLPAANTIPIFGQWNGSGNQNSWMVNVSSIGELKFSLAASDGNANTGSLSLILGTVVINRDYHVVIEIIDNVISGYVDGELVGTITQDRDFVNSNAAIRNIYDSTLNTRFFASKVWDIRVAKRALYNGVINRKRFPRIGRKPHLTSNLTTSSLGNYPGAAQNVNYGTTKNISVGAFSETLFKDIRSLPAKTIRLVNLTHDRNQYIILGFKPTDIPPTDDMPIFTDKLVFNGTQLAGIAATIAGGAVPANLVLPGTSSVVKAYWTLSDSANVSAFDDGCHIPFEFI